MLQGRYTLLLNNVWGITVDGKVSSGHKVAISRPNGSIHIHTVHEIYQRRGSIRVCSVVPVISARVREVFR